MTHEKEINRWAECPDGTKVWALHKEGPDKKGWSLLEHPLWETVTNYIVDDEHSQFRKAQIDGRTILAYQGGWYNINQCNEATQNFKLSPADEYYKIETNRPTYYWQWEKLDKEEESILITPHYTDRMANKRGYQVNDGWRKIESSKRIWEKR